MMTENDCNLTKDINLQTLEILETQHAKHKGIEALIHHHQTAEN